jgi:hypothetical protein
MFKQYKSGTFWGMFKLILSNIAPYNSWIQLALVAIMSYYTTINPLLSQWGVYVSFWVFLIILIGLIGAVGILEYVFMLPSYLGAFNVQQWFTKNPQRELLERMEADIKALRQDIAELKKGR